MAQLLLTGTGPAAASHKGVVKLLGFDRIKGRAPQAKIDAFVEAFLKATPAFRRDVVRKIQSGDPYETRDALMEYGGAKRGMGYGLRCTFPQVSGFCK